MTLTNNNNKKKTSSTSAVRVKSHERQIFGPQIHPFQPRQTPKYFSLEREMTSPMDDVQIEIEIDLEFARKGVGFNGRNKNEAFTNKQT